MNKNEQVAYDYLLTQGYEKGDIDFNSRRYVDFICSDGKRYEAKTYTKCLVFTENQLASFSDDISVIVVKDGKIMRVAPFGELWADVKTYPDNGGKPVKLSVQVYEKLHNIKKRGGHTSVDSVLRELLLKAGETL